MCPVTYRNVGCYKDFHLGRRPVTDQLSIEGDFACPSSDVADFEEWNDKMYDRVCKCGEKAQEGGYKYFALENCGKSLVKKKKKIAPTSS